MNPRKLSNRCIQILLAAHWTSQRDVNVREIIMILTGHNLCVSASTEAFLRQFHGLHFDLSSGPLDFDVRKVFEGSGVR